MLTSPPSAAETSKVADLTTTAAAAFLGLSKATVRALSNTGQLPCRRTAGGHRRFAEADLLAYRARGDRVAPAAAARAVVWTAAALAVLRDAEADLGPSSPLAARFRAAAAELRRPA